MAALERLWVCDTITGARLNVIPVTDFTWARGFNAGSAGSATIPVNATEARTRDLPALIVEGAHTLALESGGSVVAAGVIGDTDYDKDAGTLTVPHADIWSILAGRKAIKHGAPTIVTEKLVYGPLSLGTIAKRLVQEAISPGGWYGLPIVFPADVAGTETRTFHGYNMQDIPDALKELMESDGGPDIDFTPRWSSSGSLEWVMRAAPNLASSGVWEYNLDAPKNGATKVKAKTSTGRLVNNAFVIGEGSEKNTLIRSNPSPDHSRPASEGSIAYKSVSSLGVLGDLAAEQSRVLSAPVRHYTMSILKGGTPAVTDLSLGDTVRVYAEADPWMPSGWSVHRLIRFSGGLGPEINLEFQPVGA